MKWSDLTKGKGDKGFSQFGMNPVPWSKGHRIFQILGEIDMLNARLGMTHSSFANDIQAFNRSYMGYLHTKGHHGRNKLIEFQETLDERLKALVENLDQIDPEGPKGWHDYDNEWFVACCQARKVERLIALSWQERQDNVASGFGRAVFPNMKDGEKVLAIFNRMSKVLYCLGVLESKNNNE
jgi:cob(I)alamin adenosyltransferase